MTDQTIVAHFQSRAEAEDAREALMEEGVEDGAIRLYPEAVPEGYSRSASSYDAATDQGGFWSALANLFLPDEDRYAYAEGMSRGGTTLSVTTSAANADSVSDILERYGALDMDEQEAKWRGEGWTGYASGGSAGHGAADAGSTMSASSHAGEVATSETVRADLETAGSARRDDTVGTSGTPAAQARGDGDAVIPVVEEQLRVGKRESSGGRVRVRSYAVETPVQEQVTLRHEHVDIERRPVDRPVSAGDRVFEERTIEAQERDEEAVVSKEARVKEELVLRKDVETETRTVQDTVRRTEVEVEDERAGADTAGGAIDRR
jgi:uncharacterized protein (TIGR02271 family)